MTEVMYTVVMPLYNKAPYVGKAVASVLAQTLTQWELIVVDDGSTDGGADVVAAFADSRIRLVRQANAGVAAARNRAAAEARALWLAFLDADDWWEPDFLREVERARSLYPEADTVGTAYMLHSDGHDRPAPVAVPKQMEYGLIDYCSTYAATLCMPLTSSTTCVRREAFERCGGFPVGVQMGEDFLLWMRIALQGQVAFVNKPLSIYNLDLPSTQRATSRRLYEPQQYMTFHFAEFAEAEAASANVKYLLDRLRAHTLLIYRRRGAYNRQVRQEMAKVDFSNLTPSQRFAYRAPLAVVVPYMWAMRTLAHARHSLIKLSRKL